MRYVSLAIITNEVSPFLSTTLQSESTSTTT